MPVKIGFTVVSSTGEDERYRAADLNYHGPTVKGWRSSQQCPYPQDITLQLHALTIIHKIQILVHQYLIPHKIEIWVCEDIEYDPSVSPSGIHCFQYLGFITLSDNRSTGFKSRELKSVTTPPTAARFLKLKLYENHANERNVYNQVGLVAVSILGESIPYQNTHGDELNNNESISNPDADLITNPQYTSPYDDLAFEMYVDRDVARIMRLMERKKHQAVLEERFEYAMKLKNALDKLRIAGETLGRYDQEKRQAINMEDYDKAKIKKNQIDKFRDEVYTGLCIEQLLELDGQYYEDVDSSCGGPRNCEKSPPIKLSEDVDGDDGDSFESSQSEVDTSPQSSRCTSQAAEPRVSWSPRHPLQHPQSRPRQRRTSLTEYPTHRSSAPSPNPLSHSFSQTTFPTSHSIHQLLQCNAPQFQCYTPYPCQPIVNIPKQPSLEQMYQSLPPIRLQEPFYLSPELERENKGIVEASKETKPQNIKTECRSPPLDKYEQRSRASSFRAPSRQRSRSTVATTTAQNSYEAYEERMLPALRHPQLPVTDVVRECQLAVDQTRKSKLNEREKKLAALPISVFGIDLVEKFHSKHFADKEEGLRSLQEELNNFMTLPSGDESKPMPQISPNKMARASIFLLHRALRDKVYSVYSAAADAIRFFFHEFVPGRVSQAEIARSVEKLLPELIAKSGDATPRIHNMAAHTLLSMVDCKHVRELHIIPAQLSRPLSSSVHPRLALSRLEMVDQLILNHGISTEKQSGLTCRTLAEFGSSGLHHPAEAVRKVSERILMKVYKVNPRLVRKQLPPDDDVTRRNLLYRQLFQEFDIMDLEKQRERAGQESKQNPEAVKLLNLPVAIKDLWHSTCNESTLTGSAKTKTALDAGVAQPSQIPKRTVNQMTSPIQPLMLFDAHERDTNANRVTIVAATKNASPNNNTILKSNNQMQHDTLPLLRRRNMSRISEEDGNLDSELKAPIMHFPNLVDSVHLTEHKRVQQSNNQKPIEYIFPTTYIGNEHKLVEACNKSKIPLLKSNNDAKIEKKKPKASGIPVPKHGFKSRGKSSSSTMISQNINKQILNKNSTLSSTNNTSHTGIVCTTNDRINLPAHRISDHDHDHADANSSPASANTPPSDSETLQQTQGAKFKACIFCLAKGNWGSEEKLNLHYWKNCPMLTQCSKCNEVVEISGLIQHKLGDCEFKKSFMKCDKCQEAILKEDWDGHFCKASKSFRLRCSFCHDDLPSMNDWKNHLMGKKICSNHPRKLLSI